MFEVAPVSQMRGGRMCGDNQMLNLTRQSATAIGCSPGQPLQLGYSSLDRSNRSTPLALAVLPTNRARRRWTTPRSTKSSCSSPPPPSPREVTPSPPQSAIASPGARPSGGGDAKRKAGRRRDANRKAERRRDAKRRAQGWARRVRWVTGPNPRPSDQTHPHTPNGDRADSSSPTAACRAQAHTPTATEQTRPVPIAQSHRRVPNAGTRAP